MPFHYDHDETERHILEAGHGSRWKGMLIVFSPFIIVGTWTVIVLAFGR